jgi:hypothetical protein
MTERPILFSGPLVRAILAGRKTQTRRLVTAGTSACYSARLRDLDLAASPDHLAGADHHLCFPAKDDGIHHRVRCRVEAGDVLWVREAFRVTPNTWCLESPGLELQYRADDMVARIDSSAGRARFEKSAHKPTDMVRARLAPSGLVLERGSAHRWRPSIHMPKWASRIRLRVAGVRAEPLEHISEGDAEAEGCDPIDGSYRLGFSDLWDRINGERCPWSSNPWVWIYDFERLE